jgi:hypothetical protein
MFGYFYYSCSSGIAQYLFMVILEIPGDLPEKIYGRQSLLFTSKS